ncbi:DUF3135 domain-containing protein [Reinekea thalattae]|uniref:DUF3135 domain-containing protein n=1 Tax=Reinekea thalattae TaxID=2593301 RepID=A0A5C8Z6B0_9GAMM|nr:DUF3135 domain-containing protein [Reinekea thalattae]TXR53645.1 DUF3135 domain-containing protein [Reinekea thalattae]
MLLQWPTTDELIQLAKDNPEELEALRKREIESTISRAPDPIQRRLRGIQFRVDAQRKLCKTPLSSCVAISQMMIDSFYDLNDSLQSARSAEHESRSSKNQTTGDSNVLPFTTDR